MDYPAQKKFANGCNRTGAVYRMIERELDKDINVPDGVIIPAKSIRELLKLLNVAGNSGNLQRQSRKKCIF